MGKIKLAILENEKEKLETRQKIIVEFLACDYKLKLNTSSLHRLAFSIANARIELENLEAQ